MYIPVCSLVAQLRPAVVPMAGVESAADAGSVELVFKRWRKGKRVAQVVVKCFTTSCRSSYDCGRGTKAKVSRGASLVFVAAADDDATTRKLQCLSLKRELWVERVERRRPARNERLQKGISEETHDDSGWSRLPIQALAREREREMEMEMEIEMVNRTLMGKGR
jgi:hypothetical protein